MPIELKSVSYVYNIGGAYETAAVKDVSLKIEKAQIVGLIGHTGSGKSTLIQLFNGLLRPTSGRVLFDGEDIWGGGYDLKALRFRVGLVFQYPEYQFFETSILKDVCFGPENMGCDKDEAKKRAVGALDRVGIEREHYDRSPFEISGGLKRRAAIAGVLAMEPEYLILDEPTAGLDPQGKYEMLSFLSKLRDKNGISVVLVTHDMDEAAEYADRLIVLNEGEKAFDGSVQKVFSHYEELEAMSLASPQVSYLMRRLRQRGLPVDETAVTLLEARESILRAFGKERPC